MMSDRPEFSEKTPLSPPGGRGMIMVLSPSTTRSYFKNANDFSKTNIITINKTADIIRHKEYEDLDKRLAEV